MRTEENSEIVLFFSRDEERRPIFYCLWNGPVLLTLLSCTLLANIDKVSFIHTERRNTERGKGGCRLSYSNWGIGEDSIKATAKMW